MFKNLPVGTVETGIIRPCFNSFYDGRCTFPERGICRNYLICIFRLRIQLGLGLEVGKEVKWVIVLKVKLLKSRLSFWPTQLKMHNIYRINLFK